MCKVLGNTTAKYRWFAIFYLLAMFVVVPGAVMVLSLNTVVFICVMTPALILLIFVIGVNFAQTNGTLVKYLPKKLENWDFLPKPLHSLEYWDRYGEKTAFHSTVL